MAATTSSVDTTAVQPSATLGVADTALAKPDELKPATDVAASGAMIEPTIVERIDTAHPAVDNSPRAGQPVVANRIDFNDPRPMQEIRAEAEAKAAEKVTGDKPKA